jgi:hypothetical protein
MRRALLRHPLRRAGEGLVRVPSLMLASLAHWVWRSGDALARVPTLRPEAGRSGDWLTAPSQAHQHPHPTPPANEESRNYPIP